MFMRFSVILILSTFLVVFKANIHAQNTPFDKLQTYSADGIAEKNIKSITGYEFHYHPDLDIPDSLIVAGQRQTFEAFDRSGRITEKINFWEYADFGSQRKVYGYDSVGNVIHYQQFSGDSLERTEKLSYNELNNVVQWMIDFSDEEFPDVEKHVEYIDPDIPIVALIKQKEEVIAKDSMHTYYDVYGRSVIELVFNENGDVRDSVVYKYNMGDTIYSQYIYTDGQIANKNYLIELYDLFFYRTEEYHANRFIGVVYKMYNQVGNLIKEKRIHHFPDMNYEIKYIYDDNADLVHKEVYKNKVDPEFVVKFDVKYYDEGL